ncbi:hypothetical protein PoB_003315200 [Plakobranchus ocellatus]|uniref:Uncharacterized protein n=1 Tax=Plakobranchus ocellatus TaxID=259542 RepID=A0AAV4AI02_9GAST|nr:hypothetical protein PoB_003315200 [Plakobranchus ocellatus]
MTMKLTEKRKSKILEKYEKISSSWTPARGDAACLIGLFAASFPAVPCGPFRNLEFEKCVAYKKNGHNWENYMALSSTAIEEVEGWITEYNVNSAVLYKKVKFD